MARGPLHFILLYTYSLLESGQRVGPSVCIEKSSGGRRDGRDCNPGGVEAEDEKLGEVPRRLEKDSAT